MARLTITLPDHIHRDLKVRAAMSGQSIGELFQQALEDQRSLARIRLLEFVEQARAHAATVEPQLTEDELMELAVAETHAVREEIAAERRRSGTRG